MRTSKRTQASLAGVIIPVMLFVSGCGPGNCSKQYLIWRIIDGRKNIYEYEGVADSWALNIKFLQEYIVCFGPECFGRNWPATDDSGTGRRLIALQIPLQTQGCDTGVPPREKPLFAPNVHFALASLLGRITVSHEPDKHKNLSSEREDAVEMGLFDAAVYCDRGAVYAENGLYDRAISDYSKAVEMDPKFAKAYYDRGIAYYRKGRHKLAIADYARAIEINPQLHKQDDIFVRLVREKWARLKESRGS